MVGSLVLSRAGARARRPSRGPRWSGPLVPPPSLPPGRAALAATSPRRLTNLGATCRKSGKNLPHSSVARVSSRCRVAMPRAVRAVARGGWPVPSGVVAYRDQVRRAGLVASGGRSPEAGQDRAARTAGVGLARPATNLQQRGHLGGNRAGLPNDTHPPEAKRCGACQRGGIVSSLVAEHLGLRLVPQPPVQLDDDPELLVEDVPVGGPRVERPGWGLPLPRGRPCGRTTLAWYLTSSGLVNPVVTSAHTDSMSWRRRTRGIPRIVRRMRSGVVRRRRHERRTTSMAADSFGATAARSRTVCSTVSTGGRRLG